MAIFTKDNISSKRTASVKAVEDSTLIVIMKYAIIELSQKHENIYNKIESIIAERIRKNQS
jgi:CRP-like cAMP-binding protein